MKYDLNSQMVQKISSYNQISNKTNLDVEDNTQEKPLFLVIQKIWFDKIESGQKTEEYRDNTHFYRSRLLNKESANFKNYKTVILQEGYKPNARRMLIEVEKITLDRIFTIHLGEILERINF